MDKIDRDIFFRDLPLRTGIKAGKSQTAALNFLLDQFENDPSVTMVRRAAYILATAGHETMHTFKPIRELRADKTKQPKLWRQQERYWPSGYYGRGFVQITWDYNYRDVGNKVLTGKTVMINGQPVTFEKDTLLNNPDYALEPGVAYELLVQGMEGGLYTGKKLGKYIPDNAPPDYVKARQVVNGMDRAEEIATKAMGFELVLRAAI